MDFWFSHIGADLAKREVQRTMLELLNQLDGFSSEDRIKVVAATNRIDILDPALLRSGRLDRKIEFPHPTEEARARILQIHSRKMNVSDDVNYEELARCTDDFNGAQLKVRLKESFPFSVLKFSEPCCFRPLLWKLVCWHSGEAEPNSGTKTMLRVSQLCKPRRRLPSITMPKHRRLVSALSKLFAIYPC